MTTAERVAVLDRQLEASTGVFDAIIREEQRQQRSSRREQSSQSQSSGGSGTESSSGGRNPYEASDEGGYGSVGGGIGGRSGGAPENPAVFEHLTTSRLEMMTTLSRASCARPRCEKLTPR